MDFACRQSNSNSNSIGEIRNRLSLGFKVNGRLQRIFTTRWENRLDQSLIFSLIVIPKEARAWGELSRCCCG
jgi:hypothetical protein